MTPEGEKLLADLIATERADLTPADFEDRTCRGCGNAWSVNKYGLAPRPTKWIAEAREWWHLRCRQAQQEREGKQ